MTMTRSSWLVLAAVSPVSSGVFVAGGSESATIFTPVTGHQSSAGELKGIFGGPGGRAG
jgi:hypothetical protein